MTQHAEWFLTQQLVAATCCKSLNHLPLDLQLAVVFKQAGIMLICLDCVQTNLPPNWWKTRTKEIHLLSFFLCLCREFDQVNLCIISLDSQKRGHLKGVILATQVEIHWLIKIIAGELILVLFSREYIEKRTWLSSGFLFSLFLTMLLFSLSVQVRCLFDVFFF